jgi:autotransporter-associated beta strand protein
LACSCLPAYGQVTTTYTPDAWVVDPYSPNSSWTITGAGTASPTYVSSGANESANMYGYSPIGSTITLTTPGTSAILTSVVDISGDVAYANLQFRYGMVFKGTNKTDTNWDGSLIAFPNAAGQPVNYEEKPGNNSVFSTGGSATTEGATGNTFVTGSQAGPIAFTLSVTYLGATSNLVSWTVQGLSGNAFVCAGRYTNTTPSILGGFSFDTIGFLKGGSVFTANSTANAIAFENVQVVVGNFGDGVWSAPGSGLWSASGNWANGAVANGTGFFADFSQVDLASNSTVTLDSSRSVRGLIFGATSGSPFNWLVNSTGGSALSLNNNGLTTVPNIAVNENMTTLDVALDSTNGLSESGPGILVLEGNNSIAGPLNLNGGELGFYSLANLPLSSGGISSITFGGGGLQWEPGNTVDISSAGINISFAGNAVFDTGSNNVTFADNFGDGGVGGFAKLGAGTLTLNGAASYSGTTTVSNGVLALGSSGSISSSTNIVVLSNATLNVSALSSGLTLNQNEGFSGAGTIIGNVSDATGDTLGSGFNATGAAGTLTVNGNLTLNGGETLTFGLADLTAAGGGTNDLIDVSGTLTIAGTTTLNVNLINGAPGLGTYTLFTYGTFSGNAANLIAPLGFSVTNNTTAKAIQLVVTHVPQSLTWKGGNSANVWDTDTTENWLDSGSAAYFFTGDAVTFNAAGSDSPYINIAGTVDPASVTVSSSGYDFAGTGGIATGKLSLTSGTLILENNNTYTGPTVISSGAVLQVGGPTEGGATGSLGTGPVTNNGALVFDLSGTYAVTTNIPGTGSISNIGSAGTVTLSGNISGGAVTMAGGGAMVLSGSNTYTGQTIVSSGSLQVTTSNALGSGTALVSVSNGAQLYITANVNLASNKPIYLQGTGNNANGALEKGGSGVTYMANPITLTGDATIQVDGGSTLYLTNAAGITAPGTNLFLGAASGGAGYLTGPLNLGPAALTSQGAGTWTIAPSNNFTGGTALVGGTLDILSSNALGPVVANPAFVTFNGGTLGVTNNISFVDGVRGFTVSGTGDLAVTAPATLVISDPITGTGTLTKSGSGILVLSGTNSFSGTFNVDSDSNANNDGTVIVTTSGAIANVATPIALRNTLGGSSIFEVIGTNGNIVVTQDFTVGGRSPLTPAILSSAGTNTLSGNFTFGGGGLVYILECDNGLLTLGASGTSLTFSATDPETITFQGNGSIAVAGVISDGPDPTSVVKTGNGSLTLGAVNTYSGSTTVSGGALIVNGTIGAGTVTVTGGTLGGMGTIGGPVSVGAAATFAPGAPLGALTINNSLGLAGNTAVTVNGSASSQVVGLTSVTYGGTLTVANLGGALTTNSSFTLFSASSFSGNFASISGPQGVTLSFNPTNGVLSVASILPSSPTNLTYSVSAGAITLNWPASYTGWILQAQTNPPSVGITTNWVDVAGTASLDSLTLPISTTNTVFFRLRHP